jgi:RNA polymerase sigma factor (sigma-70 family)
VTTRPSPEQKEDILTRLGHNIEDEDAWSDLYRAFWPFVFAKIYRLLNGNAQPSRELTHDVFVQLARARPFAKLDSIIKFHNYLGMTCSNVVRDFYRRTRRDGQLCHGAVWEDILVSDHSTNEALEDILPSLYRRLDEMERLLLTLLVEGASTSEIARRLNTSDGNARVRICRFRVRLRSIVSKETGPPAASYSPKRARFL